LKSSLDRLILLTPDLLLTRVLDARHQYHPYYYNRLPELQPSHWYWELFNRQGELVGQFAMPSTFTPMVRDGCGFIGTSTDEDGVQSIARVALGAGCSYLG